MEKTAAQRRPEKTMTIKTMIPAIRRGIARNGYRQARPADGQRFRNQPQVFPLSREETRLAVIEVLG